MSVENVHAFYSLPWRRVTPMHAQLGARARRKSVVCSTDPSVANVLANFLYTADTIDRIIGMRISLQKDYRNNQVAFNVQDLDARWRQDFTSMSQLQSVWLFNVETLNDSCNLVLYNTGAQPMTIDVSLYNVEMFPYTWAG